MIQTKVFKQQLETPDLMLQSPNGNFVSDFQGNYKVRKSVRPQTKDDNYQSRTFRSTGNVINQKCVLCHESKEIQAQRLCSCQFRFYHANCLMDQVRSTSNQGLNAFRCGTCNFFYPFIMTKELTLNYLSSQQKIGYSLLLFFTLIIILLCLLLLVFIDTNVPTKIVLISLIVLFVLFLTIIITKVKRLCVSIQFNFREFSIADFVDNHKQFENKAIEILKAMKYQRVNQNLVESTSIKV